MDLSKKKKLAMRTFKIGNEKILFVESRLDEIKDAITKQDLRDLEKSGAIIIMRGKGRTKVRGKANRGVGNIRKKIKLRKKTYMIITRKLREYLRELYSKGKVSKEEIASIRRKIRNNEFRSKTHFKELMAEVEK